MKPIDIEHFVTVKLNEYQDMEMILLKGHLALEQTVNQLISTLVKDPKSIDSMSLLFAKKIVLLSALLGHQPLQNYQHLKKINRIRNKLAHELFFDKYHKDLKLWACSVNGYTPKTINSNKRTYKNTVIKSFSFLAGQFMGMAEAMKVVSSRHCR